MKAVRRFGLFCDAVRRAAGTRLGPTICVRGQADAPNGPLSLVKYSNATRFTSQLSSLLIRLLSQTSISFTHSRFYMALEYSTRIRRARVIKRHARQHAVRRQRRVWKETSPSISHIGKWLYWIPNGRSFNMRYRDDCPPLFVTWLANKWIVSE